MSLRYRLEFAAFRLGSAVVRGAPLRQARRVAERLARFVFDRRGRRTRVALANLRIAFPGLPEREREEIARQSFVHFAWNVIDVVRAAHWSDQEICERVEVCGLEHARAALEKGSGAFGLMQHLGNFELVSLVAPLHGIPCTAVARPLGNPLLYAELLRQRSRTGCEIVNRRHAARAILRTLHEGRMVGVLNDQYSRRSSGLFVPLFGVRCSTSAGVATLALRSGAPVITAAIVRDGLDHHRLTIGPPLEIATSGDRARDIERATARYNEAIEEAIRREPTQYMWAHRRFRHSPDLPEDPYPSG